MKNIFKQFVTLFLYFYTTLSLLSQTGKGTWSTVFNDSHTPSDSAFFPYEFVGMNSNVIQSFGALNFFGDAPRTMISYDGGKNWQKRFRAGALDTNFPRIDFFPPRFAAPDTNLFLIAPIKDKICRSSDAGKTWNFTYFDSSYSKDHRILMINKKDGICFFRPETVYRTQDSGNTWFSSPPITKSTDSLSVIRYTRVLSPNSIVALMWKPNSKELIVSKTFDGGNTWIEDSIDLHSDTTKLEFNCASFIDAEIGWLATSYENIGGGILNVIHKTTDGGKTWRKQIDSIIYDINTPAGYLNSMDFWDKNHGLAVGNAKILRTTDGGETWKIQAHNLSTPGWLSYVKFIDAQTALIADISGAILRYSEEPPISVSEFSLSSGVFSLVPNPVSDVDFSVHSPLGLGKIGIKVVSVLGEEVFSGSAESGVMHFRLPAETASGRYTVRLYSEKGEYVGALPLVVSR